MSWLSLFITWHQQISWLRTNKILYLLYRIEIPTGLRRIYIHRKYQVGQYEQLITTPLKWRPEWLYPFSWYRSRHQFDDGLVLVTDLNPQSVRGLWILMLHLEWALKDIWHCVVYLMTQLKYGHLSNHISTHFSSHGPQLCAGLINTFTSTFNDWLTAQFWCHRFMSAQPTPTVNHSALHTEHFLHMPETQFDR